MHFSSEVNVGNILAAAAVIITLLGLHQQNKRNIVDNMLRATVDLAEIRTKVNAMWHHYLGVKVDD